MTEFATIGWFGRWGTSIFSENTAILLFFFFLFFSCIFWIFSTFSVFNMFYNILLSFRNKMSVCYRYADLDHCTETSILTY